MQRVRILPHRKNSRFPSKQTLNQTKERNRLVLGRICRSDARERKFESRVEVVLLDMLAMIGKSRVLPCNRWRRMVENLLIMYVNDTERGRSSKGNENE